MQGKAAMETLTFNRQATFGIGIMPEKAASEHRRDS